MLSCCVEPVDYILPLERCEAKKPSTLAKSEAEPINPTTGPSWSSALSTQCLTPMLVSTTSSRLQHTCVSLLASSRLNRALSVPAYVTLDNPLVSQVDVSSPCLVVLVEGHLSSVARVSI